MVAPSPNARRYLVEVTGLIVVGTAVSFFFGLQLGVLAFCYGTAAAALLQLRWFAQGRVDYGSRFVLAMIVVMCATLAGSLVDLLVLGGDPTIPVGVLVTSVLLLIVGTWGYWKLTHRYGGPSA